MAMGPYNIPREYKGEGRILLIFSTKALIYTAGGLLIGLLFLYVFKMFKLNSIGIVFLVLFGSLGFAIATFKIPEGKKFKFTVKTGGENIDSIILRWIRFKNKHNRIYVYKEQTKEEEK